MPRTPNPASGTKLPFPNHRYVVEALASERPELLARSCQSHGGTWAFMDLLVARLRAIDTRYGNNGKRGNASDPSHDVVAYNYSAEPDAGPDGAGTTQVYIIDVIVGHCGPNPQPAWIDQTAATAAGGTIGRWCLRTTTPVEPPPPVRPPYPGDAYYVQSIGAVLEADYAEAGQALNAGSATWFGRVDYDHFVGGLTMDQSVAKHRPEWRAALGLEA